jgi:hypothetical protein
MFEIASADNAYKQIVEAPEFSEVAVEGEEWCSNIHHVSHDLFYLAQSYHLLSVEAVVDGVGGSLGSSITVEPS